MQPRGRDGLRTSQRDNSFQCPQQAEFGRDLELIPDPGRYTQLVRKLKNAAGRGMEQRCREVDEVEATSGGWVSRAEVGTTVPNRKGEHFCYGLNCIPPPPANSHIKALTPSSSEYNCIWRKGHCRCN